MIQVANNLWRGPRPTNLQDLKDQGFEYIINLESGFYTFWEGDLVMVQFPSDFGLTEFNIPLSPISNSTEERIHMGLRIVARGKKTFVHCKDGVDRTGKFCAAYRMSVQGWTFQLAVGEMLALGFHVYRYFWWIPSLRKFERMK